MYMYIRMYIMYSFYVYVYIYICIYIYTYIHRYGYFRFSETCRFTDTITFTQHLDIYRCTPSGPSGPSLFEADPNDTMTMTGALHVAQVLSRCWMASRWMATKKECQS